MSINVNTNVAAMTAQRHLNSSNSALEKSMERLSSGLRINSAADDAAGLQISNRLTSQSRGLDVAMRNANDGISIAQTAEGAMKEVTSILQRVRDLSIQSANGSNSIDERQAMNEEVSALIDEVNRIAETTSFGGRKMLNGTFGQSSFQVGAHAGEAVIMGIESVRADAKGMGGATFTATEGKDQNWSVPSTRTYTDKNGNTVEESGANIIEFSYTDEEGNQIEKSIAAKIGDDIEELATYINGQIKDVQASVDESGHLQFFIASKDYQSEDGLSISGSLADELGLAVSNSNGTIKNVQDIDITHVGGAQSAIGIVDSAMQYIDSMRANLGAQQNRLISTINNLSNVQENVESSNSRIKDTDWAKETTEMTKQQILRQAGTSVLTQAKGMPKSALSLIGN